MKNISNRIAEHLNELELKKLELEYKLANKLLTEREAKELLFVNLELAKLYKKANINSLFNY